MIGYDIAFTGHQTKHLAFC